MDSATESFIPVSLLWIKRSQWPAGQPLSAALGGPKHGPVEFDKSGNRRKFQIWRLTWIPEVGSQETQPVVEVGGSPG